MTRVGCKICRQGVTLIIIVVIHSNELFIFCSLQILPLNTDTDLGFQKYVRCLSPSYTMKNSVHKKIIPLLSDILWCGLDTISWQEDRSFHYYHYFI